MDLYLQSLVVNLNLNLMYLEILAGESDKAFTNILHLIFIVLVFFLEVDSISPINKIMQPEKYGKYWHKH